ncbi:MAG TPA: hypothetical protein EYO90_08850, partial [Candidatus Latescibacteria bacterium]|nr:hypothetical protein [Candidatus Latescibacterota bacterium]
GFCLWPTETTPHSVQASPWRGGRGDLVGEAAEACRAAGLRFGIYLSPWDAYAWKTLGLSDAEYDQYYMRQLTELLTSYGEVTEVWWDGAGSKHRRHDWRAYYRLIKSLQPGAVIMGAGCSDVRWIWEVPEEQGLGHGSQLARDPCPRFVCRGAGASWRAGTLARRPAGRRLLVAGGVLPGHGSLLVRADRSRLRGASLDGHRPHRGRGGGGLAPNGRLRLQPGGQLHPSTGRRPAAHRGRELRPGRRDPAVHLRGQPG